MSHEAPRSCKAVCQLIGAIGIIALFVSACASALPDVAPKADAPATATPVPPTATPLPVPPMALDGTNWIALTYVDANGDPVDVLPEALVDITFADGKVNGTAGCNRYFADAQIDGATIVLGPAGATRMACGEALDGQETAYLAALDRVAAFTVDDGLLALLDADGAVLATFVEAVDAASPENNASPEDDATAEDAVEDDLADTPDLAGTVWTWVRFDGSTDTDSIAVGDPSRYTLELLNDGTYALQADCNRAGGDYTLDGSALALEPGPMTLAECGPDSHYDTYIRLLGEVTAFAFDGPGLVLETISGTLTFAPAE